MNVSICVATFGDEQWRDLALARALPSTDGQPYHEVLQRHDEGATLAEARNRLAERASGDWLCFLDADDELAPGYLDAMAAAAIIYCPTGVACTGCRYCENDRERPRLLVPAVQYIELPRDVLTNSGAVPLRGYVHTPHIPQRGRWPHLNECVIGTLVPKLVFDAVGGFREFPSLEDYDLWLRCYDVGCQLAYVEDAVYRANVNPEGRNRDQSPYQRIWADHLARVPG